MTKPSPAPPQRYLALDALRGVAAVMVVLLHSSRLLGGQLSPGGYLAVDLFFALSGFVIAHAYDKRLAQGLAVGRFVGLRLIRFWPLYALGTLFGVLHQSLLLATHNAFALSPPMLAVAGLLALCFVPQTMVARNDNLFPLNPPAWSLFLELLVNAAYAAALPRLSNRMLAAIIALAGIAFAGLCAMHGSADMGATVETLPGGIARTLFSFGIGVLVYRAGWRPFALPLPVLLLLVVVALALPVPAGLRAGYDIGFVLLVSPLLLGIGAATALDDQRSRAGRIAARLGLISYPIYAIHRPLVEMITPVALKLHLPVSLRVILLIGGLAVASLLLDRYFDRPARRILSAVFRSRPEPPLPETSLP